jgi:hypothetical protein
MKLLFAFLCCVGLCSCETMPVDDAPLDETDAVAPVDSPPGRASLMDPRTYMDKPDTNLQALLSSRRFR